VVRLVESVVIAMLGRNLPGVGNPRNDSDNITKPAQFCAKVSAPGDYQSGNRLPVVALKQGPGGDLNSRSLARFDGRSRP
jgi:hypothetical protein